jgi:hypothetical protein
LKLSLFADALATDVLRPLFDLSGRAGVDALNERRCNSKFSSCGTSSTSFNDRSAGVST